MKGHIRQSVGAKILVTGRPNEQFIYLSLNRTLITGCFDFTCHSDSPFCYSSSKLLTDCNKLVPSLPHLLSRPIFHAQLNLIDTVSCNFFLNFNLHGQPTESMRICIIDFLDESVNTVKSAVPCVEQTDYKLVS